MLSSPQKLKDPAVEVSTIFWWTLSSLHTFKELPLMGLHDEKKWSFPHFVGIWCYITPIKAFWEKCYSNTTVRALFLQQKKCSFVYAHTVDMLKSMSQYPLCWCTASVVTVSPMLVHYKCGYMLVHYKCGHSIPCVGALQVWSQYPLCWCTTSVVTVSPMLVHYKCGHSIPYVGALQVWLYAH